MLIVFLLGIKLVLLTAEETYNNKVALFEENFDKIAYGLFVSSDTILLPNFGEKSSDLKFWKADVTVGSGELPPPTVTHPMPSQKLISDTAAVVKVVDHHLTNAVRINRYPVCNKKINNENSPVFSVNSNPFNHFDDEECSEIFENYNPKKQICGSAEEKLFPGESLMTFRTEYGNNMYVVALSDSASTSNATLFNFIHDKCSKFPNYPDHCDLLEENPAQFSYCNARILSLDILTSNHSEVVLVGNIEVGNDQTFLPIGFGIVVSVDQMIVFSDVLEFIENFEIYGSGSKLKFAYMINKTVHDEEDYEVISSSHYLSGKSVKLLKFNQPIFKDRSMAHFNFNEANENVLQMKNVETIPKSDEISAIIPLFLNDEIVGFKEGGEFLSTFKMKEFLVKHVSNLIVATTTTTSTTTTTTTIKPEINILNSSYTVSPTSRVENSTSSDPENSNASNCASLLVLGILMLLNLC